MGRKRRKDPREIAQEEFREILDAMTTYGIPLDAQEKIVVVSWKFVKQSYGYSEIMKMIHGPDWEPPVEEDG